MSNVLVVDDEPQLLETSSRVLTGAGHDVSTAPDAATAMDRVKAGGIDLVITDMNMPGDTGLSLIAEVRRGHPGVATIMVTAEDDKELVELALASGSYGFIIKPFKRSELLIATSNALRRRALEIENTEYREHLEEKVRARTAELWKALQTLERSEQDLRVSREDTIQRLSVAAEFHDDETAAHLKRMSRYCGLLSEWAGLDEARAKMIQTASIMHDVGKIGIRDSVLLKPGKLTPDEYAQMQQHAEFGHRILLGPTSELLDLAAMIALTHHERWDGAGYPNGLKGEDIPIEGRIAAIADVFDALTSNRVYRKAFDLPDAIKIMKTGRGSQFDSELFDCFLNHLDEVLVAKREEEDSYRTASVNPA